jgi:hypothetical protein
MAAALLAGLAMSGAPPAAAPPEAVTVQTGPGVEAAQLYVQSGGPYLREAVALGVDARDVAVAGRFAFVAAGSDGFVVLSLDGGKAHPAARLAMERPALRIVLGGDTAWLLGADGLTAIDVHEPTAPRALGRYRTPSAPLGLALSGGRGCLLLERELRVLDLRAAGQPRLLSRLGLQAGGRSIAATDDRVYVAAGRAGVLVFDISRPDAPLPAGRLSAGAAALDLALSGHRLYVAAGDAGLTVFTVDGAAPPRWLGSLQVGQVFDRLAVAGDRALGHTPDGRLYLLDVANPDAMSIAARLAEGCCQTLRLSGPAEAQALAGGSLFTFDLAPLRPRLGNEGLAFGQGVNLGGQRRIDLDGDTAYVADWFSGLHVYDVSQPRRPVLLASLHTGGSSKGVVVRDGIAYIADDDHGLQVIDVHDRRHPRRIAGVDTPGLAYTPVLEGDRLYLAGHRGGLAVIDVADPAAPALIGQVELPGKAWSLRVRDGLAYVAADDAGLLVIDVRDPRAPRIVGQFNPGGHAEEVVLDGATAYVAFFEGEVRVLDLRRPSAPAEIARLDTPGNARGLTLDGKTLYIADWLAGIQIADVGDPAHPVVVGHYDTDGAAWGLALRGGFAVVADWWGGLAVLDVHDPQTPVLAGSYPRRHAVEQVAVAGRFAYAARGEGGVQVFDIQNPLNPTWAAGIDLPDARQLAIVDQHLYVAGESGRISVIDVTDPSEPRLDEDIRLDHPVRLLRADGARLLAVGGREATLIDPASGHRWPLPLPDTASDAWLDHGQAFVATQAGNLEVTAAQDGVGETVGYPAGGRIARVCADADHVALAMAGGGIRLLSRAPGLRLLGRLAFAGPVDDLRLDGGTLYVASGRELVRYDISTPPPWRIESAVEMLEPIGGLTVGEEAVYLAGSQALLAIDPPPDFPISMATPGAATITIPPGAPAGAYDLAGGEAGPSRGPVLVRGAVEVAPLHFGRPPPRGAAAD